MNILLIIFISFLFASGSNAEELKTDGLCKITQDVLCVKDVLMLIATVTKSINQTAYEIEKQIVKKIQNLDTLDRYVNFEMHLIQSQLPVSRDHAKFFQMNNIDKVCLLSFSFERNDFFIEIFNSSIC
jgi:hypothetical protein